MTMEGLFEDQPPCNVTKDASASNHLPNYYLENGSNAPSMDDNHDVIIKNSSVFCFPLDLNLSLGREVVLAEAVGTFIIMFSICGIIASTALMKGQVGLLEYAVTAALAVVVVVFSIGSISGAHLNPAVTVAFATVGPFPWAKVPLYLVAHVVGNVLATYAGSFVYGVKSEIMMTKPLGGYTATFFAEFMASFIILFLAASLAHAPQSVLDLSGFIVAVAIGLGVLITGPISGGSMNPARSLGPAIVAWKFEGLWIYLTAPILGSVAGAFVLRILKPCSSLPTSTSSTSTTIASSANASLHSRFLQLP